MALSSVTIYHSPKFAAHVVPHWHPESPARTSAEVLEAVVDALGCDRVVRRVATLHPRIADGSALGRVHTASYLSSLAEPIGPKEIRSLDPDTFLSRASWNVTRLAASAWLSAVDDACARRGTAFALSRPPGHHAGVSWSCGFCTLNFAAAAAAHALEARGLDRVGILDIDVHFGNGVAAILGGDETLHGRVRYCSVHQHPCFPFSGGAGDERNFDKTGRFDTLRFVPLEPGTSGPHWLASLADTALPFLEELDPQLLVVSAGFDGLLSDTLAQFCLLPADFRDAGRAIRRIFPEVPIAAGLEGGYDTAALPEALAAFLDGILLESQTPGQI